MRRPFCDMSTRYGPPECTSRWGHPCGLPRLPAPLRHLTMPPRHPQPIPLRRCGRPYLPAPPWRRRPLLWRPCAGVSPRPCRNQLPIPRHPPSVLSFPVCFATAPSESFPLDFPPNSDSPLTLASSLSICAVAQFHEDAPQFFSRQAV
jgi:hypothetical protein